MRFKINCVQLLNREIWCGYYLDLIMAIFGHVGQKERGNERMNNFSTNEEGKIDYAKNTSPVLTALTTKMVIAITC